MTNPELEKEIDELNASVKELATNLKIDLSPKTKTMIDINIAMNFETIIYRYLSLYDYDRQDL